MTPARILLDLPLMIEGRPLSETPSRGARAPEEGVDRPVIPFAGVDRRRPQPPLEFLPRLVLDRNP